MHLEIRISDDYTEVRISGDTFTVKDTIKSLGRARWDSAGKQWILSGEKFSSEKFQELFPHALISGGAQASSPETRSIAPEPLSGNTFGASSVRELNGMLQGALLKMFPGTVKVFGKISSLKTLSNGRVYFDLTDLEKSDVTVSAVLWERDAGAVLRPLLDSGFTLENDLPVLLLGQVGMNQKRAQISLRISGCIPEFTLGKLLAEREKTNTRLKNEELFDLNKKRKLPLLPARLGVLTSTGGTVINDFLASLEVCRFGFSVFWYPVRVQGASASKELCEGIRYFNTRNDIDAILVFRGGGSASELGVFNSYEVARAVCTSEIPVCSAIGHEYDQTSVQDVSYLSCGVPKDLGRFFSDLVLERRQQVMDNSLHIQEEATRTVSDARQRFLSVSEQIVMFGERALMSARSGLQVLAATSIERMYSALQVAATHIQRFTHIYDMVYEKLAVMSEKLDYHTALLQAVSPETQLARGFALIRSEKEACVTSVDNLIAGEEYTIVLKDGEAATKIIETNKREYGRKE
jgi:exodeoxyribonuclease VII large subunit